MESVLKIKLTQRVRITGSVEERGMQAHAAVSGMRAMEVAEIIKKAAAGSGLSIWVFNSLRGVEIKVRGQNAGAWLSEFLKTLSPM